MVGLPLLHEKIITVDPERRIIENGGIAIEKGRIVDIDTAEKIQPRHTDKKGINRTGKTDHSRSD